ncbi:MAG: VWA domain-containing protein [Planctomycetota bacterium]
MSWGSPWWLIALAWLPIWVWRMRRCQPTAIAVSGLGFAAAIKPSWRQRTAWVPTLLAMLASATLIVAMARPREGQKRITTMGQGIAIQILIDRSGSMRAMDFELDGSRVNRLTAIQNVASAFVLGEDELAGRISDLIGLITFARYADDQSPPTLDHAFVVSQLRSTSIVDRRDEDGTAIGDAIALAVEKLQSLENADGDPVESKVIILLTDGENTAGELNPAQAAELAETFGIKIYTIGVGTRGRAPVPTLDVFGRRQMAMMDVRIDEATLQRISEATGGQYFRATDTDSMRSIYEQIDELEKTEVESMTHVDYREWAVDWFPTRFGRMPPLLFVAAGLWWASLILGNTVWRTSP